MSPQKLQDEVSVFFDTHLKSYVDFERQFAHVMARFLTTSLGSLWFLNANIGFIGIWIIVNLGWIPGVEPFDPYPFALLMIAVFSAMFLPIVVLINQNQQGRMIDIRQRIDFEINVRAEHEITKILKMLDELHLKLGMVKVDKELESMKERIDIIEIKEDIDRGSKEKMPARVAAPSSLSDIVVVVHREGCIFPKDDSMEVLVNN